MSLLGKRILLGVTGGIAAYKACELLRLLVKAGADVEVMMTKAAAQFVGPLTFETLSGKPVAEDLWDPKMRLPHISLRKNKDLIVIAPATANIIAKAANGIADDLVSSTLLARECPLMLCPAMNVQMWRNAATVRNIQTLKGDGVLFPVRKPAVKPAAMSERDVCENPCKFWKILKLSLRLRYFPGKSLDDCRADV